PGNSHRHGCYPERPGGPERSQYKTLTWLARRLMKQNKCPLRGSCFISLRAKDIESVIGFAGIYGLAIDEDPDPGFGKEHQFLVR
ncbi:hypothetical protein, partial [Ferrovum myxofaciens]